MSSLRFEKRLAGLKEQKLKNRKKITRSRKKITGNRKKITEK
ncbi:MAG: hypothetical protein PHG79_09145 [Methanosarcina sp.]|nr:hypothetical protein [Methanosarcina sp.]